MGRDSDAVAFRNVMGRKIEGDDFVPIDQRGGAGAWWQNFAANNFGTPFSRTDLRPFDRATAAPDDLQRFNETDDLTRAVMLARNADEMSAVLRNERFFPQEAAPTPFTDAAKRGADVANEFITPAQAEQARLSKIKASTQEGAVRRDFRLGVTTKDDREAGLVAITSGRSEDRAKAEAAKKKSAADLRLTEKKIAGEAKTKIGIVKQEHARGLIDDTDLEIEIATIRDEAVEKRAQANAKAEKSAQDIELGEQKLSQQARSDIAIVEEDFRANRISEAQRDAKIAKITNIGKPLGEQIVEGVTRALSPVTEKGLEAALVNQASRRERLQGIYRAVENNQELLRLPAKAQDVISRGKDFIFGANPEEAAAIKRQAKIRRRVNEELVLLVKEISGAQVSDKEREFLKEVTTSLPGSPVALLAVLEDVIMMNDFATARLTLWDSRGREGRPWLIQNGDVQRVLEEEIVRVGNVMIEQNQIEPSQAVELATSLVEREFGISPGGFDRMTVEFDRGAPNFGQ